jgi:molybdopterin/thiamine biosynthesis adenylyltransferase
VSDSPIERIQRLVSNTPGADEWHPILFDLSDAEQRQRLAELIEREPGVAAYDTIYQQLIGLHEIRDPSCALCEEDRRRQIEAFLDGIPLAIYGRWVYYPWSRRLLHLLPEEEFRELRTSSNRNKITALEQQKVRDLRIGIVGLSVGHAAATTLALEEVGDYFQLADFDYLELSNMNRIRTGVHHLGVNKSYITAREIFEINPYAHVALFPDGVNERNVDQFLTGGPFGRLDLVFEECDDMQMKFLVRERARSHRICVLMQTSDRGFMDIERFDLEPDRPVFHGLTGNVRNETLKGLTTYEKVPIFLNIMAPSNQSSRLLASMVDIETTIKTWPQLASEVALGAAINTDTARRVALGQLIRSGRYCVDLTQLISDDCAATLFPGPTCYEPRVVLEAQRSDLPAIKPVRGELNHVHVRVLVAYASTAFSGGNCQPWLFRYRSGRLRCVNDVERGRCFLNYREFSSFLAFGSVTENVELVAAAMGVESRLRFAPESTDPNVVCDFLFDCSAAPVVDPLVEQIGPRVTNRKLGSRCPIDEDDRRALFDAAASRGARLQLLESDEQLQAVSDILGRIEMMRMLSPIMHLEMMSEIRWTPEEVLSSRDGIDLATLEFTPTDVIGLRLISSWPFMKAIGAIGGGRGLARPARKAIGSSSAVGLLTIPGIDRKNFFQGGRALHRLWLTASARGWALQPMTTITYLNTRLACDGDGLTPSEVRELSELRKPYCSLFDVPAGHAELMLFRISRADSPTARALRRKVDDILVFE